MIPFDLSDLVEHERVEANKDWNTASASKVDFRSVIKLISK